MNEPVVAELSSGRQELWEASLNLETEQWEPARCVPARSSASGETRQRHLNRSPSSHRCPLHPQDRRGRADGPPSDDRELWVARWSLQYVRLFISS